MRCVVIVVLRLDLQLIKNSFFSGEVALAGAENSLWSVYGGNKKVPEALFTYSRALLIKDRVSSITLTPQSQYALECTNVTHLYDIVVIACPQIKTSKQNIKLVGIPYHHSLAVKYQRTVVTFVHGKLNYTYFHYGEFANQIHTGELNYTYFYYGDYAKPNQIYSVNPKLFFNSVSMIYPVKPNKRYNHRVYKVFSKERLTKAQLDLLFSVRVEVVVKEWYAYPVYSVDMPKVPFVIHDSLFYLNSIELAASAMEMSVISGKNIAKLVLKKLRERDLET